MMDARNTSKLVSTDDDTEWVSALFDGELEHADLQGATDRLGAEGMLKWHEYALIGDVLRGYLVEPSDLLSRVHNQLEQEPTVLAPAPLLPAPVHYRPYYWFAAAATVAAITWGVLSVSPLVGHEQTVPMAAHEQTVSVAHSMSGEVRDYLVAHQDYAYAVANETEMRITTVSLAGEAQ